MGSSALSTPELTPARSVGRVHLASICIMLKFVLASCLTAASLAQFVDPEKAKILKEQRFNAGDGRFGAAYAQEDGTVYRDFNFNRNGGNFGGRSAPHQASAVPPCADCAGVNPFINPFDASHRNPASFAHAPTAAPRQQFQQTFQQPQQTFRQPQQFAAPATEAPRNFFPPGQLQLNRFENGFNFDFTSQ